MLIQLSICTLITLSTFSQFCDYKELTENSQILAFSHLDAWLRVYCKFSAELSKTLSCITLHCWWQCFLPLLHCYLRFTWCPIIVWSMASYKIFKNHICHHTLSANIAKFLANISKLAAWIQWIWWQKNHNNPKILEGQINTYSDMENELLKAVWSDFRENLKHSWTLNIYEQQLS